MTKQNDKTTKSKGGVKEIIRKILVSVKKNPQMLPLLALTVSFCVYSLNLTAISNTTAKIYGNHMGLCSFATMLLSMLSYVCMFSAYPKRKKPNWLLIALMLVMYGGIIFADVFYFGRIEAACNRAESPIQITQSTAYIQVAKNVLVTHIVTVVITMIAVVIEPVYAKLVRKINTSIEVEGNGELSEIELSDEE